MFFCLILFAFPNYLIINPSVLLASSFCIKQDGLGGDICFFEFLRLVFSVLLPFLILLTNHLTTYIVHQSSPKKNPLKPSILFLFSKKKTKKLIKNGGGSTCFFALFLFLSF